MTYNFDIMSLLIMKNWYFQIFFKAHNLNAFNYKYIKL